MLLPSHVPSEAMWPSNLGTRMGARPLLFLQPLPFLLQPEAASPCTGLTLCTGLRLCSRASCFLLGVSPLCLR